MICFSQQNSRISIAMYKNGLAPSTVQSGDMQSGCHDISAHQMTTISLNLTFSGLHLLCKWISGKTKHALPSMHTKMTIAAKLTDTPKLLFCNTTLPV